MPLADYLIAERVVMLDATDRRSALAELVNTALARLPGIDPGRTLDAVIAREEGLNTGIAPGIALPHARLDALDRFIIAVGISRPGIDWGSQDDRAHLMVLLLGPSQAADQHISILAEIARVVRRESIVRDAVSASDPGEVYQLLVQAQRGGDVAVDPETASTNRRMVERAVDVAQDRGASVVMIYADDKLDLSFLGPAPSPIRRLLATPHLRRHHSASSAFHGAFEVPFARLGSERLFEFALLLAMSEGLIEPQDSVICTWGQPDSGLLNSICAIDIAESFERLLSLRSVLISGDVNHQVLNRVLSLACSLGQEGREGKSVGTLFLVGDYDQVAAHCQQMVMNPFKGYHPDQRNVLDPSLEETIKEFALIDGAFVIQGDGIVASAGTYLAAPTTPITLCPGLGARHAAAAGITQITGTLAIAVSESTGNVSLYAHGSPILVLPRNR